MIFLTVIWSFDLHSAFLMLSLVISSFLCLLTAAAAARVYQALIVPSITYCSLTSFFCQPYRAKLLELLGSRGGNIIKCKVHKFQQ